jgi:hypothetical protein
MLLFFSMLSISDFRNLYFEYRNKRNELININNLRSFCFISKCFYVCKEWAKVYPALALQFLRSIVLLILILILLLHPFISPTLWVKRGIVTCFHKVMAQVFKSWTSCCLTVADFYVPLGTWGYLLIPVWRSVAWQHPLSSPTTHRSWLSKRTYFEHVIFPSDTRWCI